MKRIMKSLLVGILLASAATCSAAEYKGNPDRLPSIGLTFGGIAETGNATLSSGGASATQPAELSNGHFVLDGRVPVSDRLTLMGSLGYTGSSSDVKETTLLDGQKVDTTGISFSVGLRIYLN